MSTTIGMRSTFSLTHFLWSIFCEAHPISHWLHVPVLRMKYWFKDFIRMIKTFASTMRSLNICVFQIEVQTVLFRYDKVTVLIGLEIPSNFSVNQPGIKYQIIGVTFVGGEYFSLISKITPSPYHLFHHQLLLQTELCIRFSHCI